MELASFVVPTVLLLTLSFTNGEVIRTNKCHLTAGQTTNCVVHEVRVTPCPQADTNSPCRMTLGSNATLEFDYTPAWGTSKAKSLAYKVGELVDVGFVQMNQDGCKYTTCPIEAGKKQHYRYDLNIGTQFPATTHQVKWTLLNEEDRKEKCCFKFHLELTN